MDQDLDMKPRRFNSVTLFPSKYAIVTPQSSRELREILINNSNCDIPRKIPAVGSKLKEQLNMEISKALLYKRGMKTVHNNYRHLLICESGYTIEMIPNSRWLATKQKFEKHHKNYKNSMKYCCITAWDNCNTGIKYRMLQHVPGYDQLSIGAQGSDDVFNGALASADSFDIVYSYHLELQDAFTKCYKKYLQKIHMELYICPCPTKL